MIGWPVNPSTPGGVHADGKTENKLICFLDGSYIELIAFIKDDPNLRQGHTWGDKKPGIIDFALSTNIDPDVHYEALNERLAKLRLRLPDGNQVSYASPVAGGRKRDDGQTLKWKVTFPLGVSRGELPFFCHDITPRELRVPSNANSTKHPSGATGIKMMRITLLEDRVEPLLAACAEVLEIKNTTTAERSKTSIFEVGSVNDGQTDGSRLHVQAPSDDAQRTVVEEMGVLLGDLVLSVSNGNSITRVNIIDNMGGIFLECQPVK